MLRFVFGLTLIFFIVWGAACSPKPASVDSELLELRETTGLDALRVSYAGFIRGENPEGFAARAGAAYKPSRNEDPAIPAQCWIETGYGTQNACKYCHTNSLADIGHGNAMPLAEDQILYSFPSPNLNRVNWSNIIHPEEIVGRLAEEDIPIPRPGDPANLEYVRIDNWSRAFHTARDGRDDSWDNPSRAGSEFQLFPALNPADLFPFSEEDPTRGGRHGFIDPEGFVHSRDGTFTGWRAVNFFPYAIFTPLTGSVSGIYLRLPKRFMTREGEVDPLIYKRNLNILESAIKNRLLDETRYEGDAASVPVRPGFYPVGTEFAHPLHYVDLSADGEAGDAPDGPDYEFPGTRSKRVKEIRYMYKWKEVGLEDLGEGESGSDDPPSVLGYEGRGWIDNGAGWILSGYIENRSGDLRTQTTEELIQCLGCHSSVGNTVDAVWSFQRKLPGDAGWREMDYGGYSESRPDRTRLPDYLNPGAGMGELEAFYTTVVGADLYGVMPVEIKSELMRYARESGLAAELEAGESLDNIFDDEDLKTTARGRRREILLERMRIMRSYAGRREYLDPNPETGIDTIKGTVFYPTPATMLANIAGYRRIVLDQSFNLGKATFGTQPDAVPFTFRSDGEVLDAQRHPIPVGGVIESRPWGEDGVGLTPTGIVRVNAEGEPVDADGAPVDIETHPERAEGHVSRGGTFETHYHPILSDKPVKRKR